MSPSASSPPSFTFSIGRRVTAVIGAALLLALAGSAIGIWSLSEVSARTAQLVDKSVITERLASDWYRNTVVSVKRTTATAVSTDPALADFFAAEVAEGTKSSNELQAKLDKLMTEPEERAVFDELVAVRKGYVAVRDKVFAAKKAGDAEGSRKLLHEGFLPGAAKIQAALQKLADMQRAQIDRAGAEVQAVNRRARTALFAFGAVAVVLGSVLGVWLVRGIVRPIRRAASVAERIARLDLTEDVRGHDRDETGHLMQSLAAMQAALRELAAQIRAATESIGTASSEIADGNADLSTRTEEAASNLQQTAASIEQMNGTVQQSAQSARTADDLAGSAARVAERGGEVVAEVIATMEDINVSSKRIADIISVIDGIAFQTNILALNAAVEAARAGEQGRGFAVVAGEVRLLAQRSADAAKEIKALIGSSVDKVDAGARLVADAGRTMTEIVDSVKRVSQIIGEISSAAAEQSQGIGQVTEAVTQIDRVTQQNAALVEQSAAAAGSLKSQAQQLAENVHRFALPR